MYDSIPIDLIENEINCLKITIINISKDKIKLFPIINKKITPILQDKIKKMTQTELEILQLELKNNKCIIIDNNNIIDTHLSIINCIDIEKTCDNSSFTVYNKYTTAYEIDFMYDEEIHYMGEMRKLAASIQQFRKKLLLKPWYKICVEYICDYAEIFTKSRLNYIENIINLSMSKYNISKDITLDIKQHKLMLFNKKTTMVYVYINVL